MTSSILTNFCLRNSSSEILTALKGWISLLTKISSSLCPSTTSLNRTLSQILGTVRLASRVQWEVKHFNRTSWDRNLRPPIPWVSSQSMQNWMLQHLQNNRWFQIDKAQLERTDKREVVTDFHQPSWGLHWVESLLWSEWNSQNMWFLVNLINQQPRSRAIKPGTRLSR